MSDNFNWDSLLKKGEHQEELGENLENPTEKRREELEELLKLIPEPNRPANDGDAPNAFAHKSADEEPSHDQPAHAEASSVETSGETNDFQSTEGGEAVEMTAEQSVPEAHNHAEESDSQELQVHEVHFEHSQIEDKSDDAPSHDTNRAESRMHNHDRYDHDGGYHQDAFNHHSEVAEIESPPDTAEVIDEFAMMAGRAHNAEAPPILETADELRAVDMPEDSMGMAFGGFEEDPLEQAQRDEEAKRKQIEAANKIETNEDEYASIRHLNPDKDSVSFQRPEEEMPGHIYVAEGVPSVQDYHIDELLRMMVERKASDIHFTVGLPPMVRIDGEVVALPFQPLRPSDSRRLIYDTLTNDNLQKFEQNHELDFGYTVKSLARFRFNVYMQRGSVAAALRYIPTKIPSFESLALPGIIRDVSKRSSGLVLVTGPTGSGKSTTIATMIDDINENRTSHIMTIEDPIEYLHQHKKCMVNQRELHSDTYSFHNALRAILREDPDIILVGELRDLETIEAALTLAETGHLVFGTLHTRNAPSTIDRVVDVFPSDQQAQIRILLGNTLEAVISQQLLPRIGGGRCAGIEIMLGTPAIKNLIREGKTHQMYSVLETSKNIGMQTMDAALAELYRMGNCHFDECAMRSVDKETFSRLAKTAA